jgi:hypothetical protein
MAQDGIIKIHQVTFARDKGKKGKSSTLHKTWLLLNLPCANCGQLSVQGKDKRKSHSCALHLCAK